MNFKKYYMAMNREQREEYASRCNTTTGYIYKHLVWGDKIPRPPLMKALAEHSGGALTFEGLVRYFYHPAGDRSMANIHTPD